MAVTRSKAVREGIPVDPIQNPRRLTMAMVMQAIDKLDNEQGATDQEGLTADEIGDYLYDNHYMDSSLPVYFKRTLSRHLGMLIKMHNLQRVNSPAGSHDPPRYFVPPAMKALFKAVDILEKQISSGSGSAV